MSSAQSPGAASPLPVSVTTPHIIAFDAASSGLGDMKEYPVGLPCFSAAQEMERISQH